MLNSCGSLALCQIFSGLKNCVDCKLASIFAYWLVHRLANKGEGGWAINLQ